MTAEAGRKVDPFVAFLVVACLALAGLVVALTLQNRSLKEQLAHGHAPELPQFKAGDVVREFTVVADGGERKTIAFGEGETKTVLFVFSSTCPACKETVPQWTKLLRENPAAQGVRVVGVQTDRLDANPAAPSDVTAAYPFPVFGYKRPSDDPLAKVPYIPAAILVDAKGTVLDAWFGVPDEAALAALKKALG